MSGVSALPQDETVVMFGGENHHCHPRILHRLAPLVGVGFFQCEGFGRFEPVAPFLAGEGVRPEVHECNELSVKSFHLLLRRYDIRCLFNDCALVVALGFYGVAIFFRAASCQCDECRNG